MNINIESIFEWGNVLDIYYMYKNILLISINIFFLILSSIFIMVLLQKKKLNKRVMYDIMKSFSYIVIAISLGFIFKILNINLDFLKDYFPILIFGVVVIVSIVISVFEAIQFYRSILQVLNRFSKNIEILIIGELLLLSVMGHLDVGEVISAAAYIIMYELYKKFFSCEDTKNDKVMLNDNSDSPIKKRDALFPSRKRQLENFENELGRIEIEPFAIMLSGDWGSGKSSFINAFSENNGKFEFVWIEAGFECEVNKLLKDIEIQIENIFKKNNILLGKENPIESYFKLVSDLVSDEGLKVVNKVLEHFWTRNKEGFYDNKNNIESILNSFYIKTNKKIIIVIDDLERCQDETRNKIFGVIHESVKLENCITLFLMGTEKKYTEHLDSQYIEKYINKDIQLCPVELDEINDMYQSRFLNRDFLNGKSKYISENAEKLKNNLTDEINKILNKLDFEYELISTKIKEKNKESSIDVNKEKQKLLKDAIEKIKANIKSPRKYKRFLFQGIQRMIELVDEYWFSNNDYNKNDWSSYNWIDIIFQVSFVKYFLNSEYEKMKKYGDLIGFKRHENIYVLEFILDGVSELYPNINKESIINKLIYKIDSIDIIKDKSQRQKLKDEIINSNIQEKNFKLYSMEFLDSSWSLDMEIIELIVTNLENYICKNKLIEADIYLSLLNCATSNIDFFDDINIQIIKRIKTLIINGISGGIFEGNQYNSINFNLSHVETKCIWGKTSYIGTVLAVILNDDDIIEYFQKDIKTVNEMFDAIVKTNNDKIEFDFNKFDNKTIAIVEYFNKINELINDIDDYEVKSILKKYIKIINNILSVLNIFVKDDFKVDENISEYISLQKNKVLEKSYKNIHNILIALKYIEDLINEKELDLKQMQGIRGIFTELCFFVMHQFKNVDFFEKEEKATLDKLDILFKNIDKNASKVGLKDDDGWDNNRIRIYRMRRILEARNCE